MQDDQLKNITCFLKKWIAQFATLIARSLGGSVANTVDLQHAKIAFGAWGTPCAPIPRAARNGHIISEYNGGETIPSNLVPMCAMCNMSLGKNNFIIV
jgi:hypothetical protein